jgi:hypothetical protein
LAQKEFVNLALRTQQMTVENQQFVCSTTRAGKFDRSADLFRPEIHNVHKTHKDSAEFMCLFVAQLR